MTLAAAVVYNKGMGTKTNHDLLTTRDVAEELGISRKGVLALVSRDLLTAILIGNTFAFERAEVERYKQVRRGRGRPALK